MEKVEDFTDLSKLSLEKLIKLRDVAKEDEYNRFADYQSARDHVIAINKVISEQIEYFRGFHK